MKFSTLGENQFIFSLCRVEALKCLLVIFRIDGEEYADIDDAKLKFNIAENVAIMFPGIISTCHVIITSNLIIHHSLFIVSMILIFKKNFSILKNFPPNIFFCSMLYKFSVELLPSYLSSTPL